MIIIGLCGAIGCGKSTAAEYFVSNHGFVELSFAKPLKEIALQLGFNHDEVYGDQKQKSEINEELGISGREFLQKFGTEIMRDTFSKVLPNYNLNNRKIWCRLMELTIKKINSDRIVISDCRFPDEEKLIKDLGGYMIRINRPFQVIEDQFVRFRNDVYITSKWRRMLQKLEDCMYNLLVSCKKPKNKHTSEMHYLKFDAIDVYNGYTIERFYLYLSKILDDIKSGNVQYHQLNDNLHKLILDTI